MNKSKHWSISRYQIFANTNHTCDTEKLLESRILQAVLGASTERTTIYLQVDTGCTIIKQYLVYFVYYLTNEFYMMNGIYKNITYLSEEF